MSTSLLGHLAWVIPAVPGAMFWYTWAHYRMSRWAEYAIIPIMLLCVLTGLGTIAWLLALRGRGGVRLTDAKVVCGLALAALDVIVPVGLALVMLLLVILLNKSGGKLSF